MAKQTSSMIVEQYFNHNYTKDQPKDPKDNPERIYKVLKTVNTLVEEIGATITPARVQELIDQGINVTVQPVK